MKIRYASAVDAEALAELAARTFRDAFAAENTPANMASYVERAFSPAQLRSELEDPASRFVLACAGEKGGPVGYAKLRSGEPDPSVVGSRPIELERLYVDRAVIGEGVGSELMELCLAEARRGGYETVWLGVWERNGRALAFYRRWGFEEVGDHGFVLGSEEQCDIIMQRAVEVGAGG